MTAPRMRAIVQRSFGGPGEVLVRVRAAGVNPIDCAARAGEDFAAAAGEVDVVLNLVGGPYIAEAGRRRAGPAGRAGRGGQAPATIDGVPGRLGWTMIEFVLEHADLARVRFAHSPVRELAASLRVLQDHRRRPMHEDWLASVRPRLAGLRLDLPLALAPPGRYLPSFLFPVPAEPRPTLADERCEVDQPW
jgi:hypothetical protein